MGKWIRLAVELAVIAVLAYLGYAVVHGTFAFHSGAELNSGEPDPMFAEEPELPTRPPELDAEEAQREHPTLDDYVPEVETPVDRTVEQLIEEAKSAA